MKYGLYILITLFSIVSLNSCKTHKRAVRNIEIKKESQITETAVEQSNQTTESSTSIRVQDETEERQFTRTTVFDSTGNIRAVQETWRQTGRNKLVVRHDTLRDISVTDKKTDIKQIENINVNQNEVTEQTRDSRSRGFFGIWFFLTAALAVSLYFIIKQIRK